MLKMYSQYKIYILNNKKVDCGLKIPDSSMLWTVLSLI